VINELIRVLTRKKFRVVFNDLTASAPISAVFGIDRGTPVDRYYIENFLAKNSQLIKGRVLEIGASHYSRLFGGSRVVACEVLHATADNKAATIVGDLTDPATLPENAIDCFICTQTFNFIFDLEKAVQGAFQLLKPGGVLLATVAGISQISRYDMDRWGDYWRLTTASAQKLFQPLFGDGLQIESFGNVTAACAFLQGVAVEELPDRALLEVNDPNYQLIVTIVARKPL
jgi:SAM-dependent methyltransferase